MAGRSAVTEFIDPPTVLMAAPDPERVEPAAKKHRSPTGAFEQPLESERGNPWFIIAIVVILIVAAAGVWFTQ